MSTGATIRDLLNQATEHLTGHSETPQLDAQVLLGEVLGVGRTHLLAHADDVVWPDAVARFLDAVGRRRLGEPVAYLVGRRAFYGREFRVDRRVLIPRPETELLVERAVELLRLVANPVVADIGTGSGAIAVTLAAELPRAQIIAVDVSAAALAVAEENARRHGVEERVHFRLGRWLEPVERPVDLVAANLPYVGTAEAALLPRDVREFEPYQALFAGDDGLDSIRTLLDQIAAGRSGAPYLRPGGWLLLEIGYAQGNEVARLVEERLEHPSVVVRKDLAGLDRLVEVQL